MLGLEIPLLRQGVAAMGSEGVWAFDTHLLTIACATALIEVPLFSFLGYRRWRELLSFTLVNIVSNLLLNETLLLCLDSTTYYSALVVGEALVVALEYTLMLYTVAGGRRLLTALCLANGASLLLGLVYSKISCS